MSIKVNINTRDSLEKGLLLVGSSRSGRVDFENAIQMLEIKKFANRLKNIIYLEEPVRGIKDIHRVLQQTLILPSRQYLSGKSNGGLL